MYILLTRGLKGLNSAVQYRQLIEHLQIIALQQYYKSLQSRSFKALKDNRDKNRRLAIQQLQC